jgi:molybdate transport system ATP-binding protein
LALEVDIKKRLGTFSMDVHFSAENETLALLGASGCGKSMTLKCIAGIEKPDEGRIILNGRTLFDSEKRINLSPQKRRVGYLFQQYALFPNMTVRQNIAAGAHGKKNIPAIIEEKVRLLHLEGLEDKRPGQLSGGQQQRVALARILANEPEILLLDEPFSALDSYLRWELELELHDTLAAYGGTSIFVSHSRDEVYRVCTSVCVLSNGRSEEKVPVMELFTKPKTKAACMLSGCKNISRIRKTGESTVLAEDWGTQLCTAVPVAQDHEFIAVRSGALKLANGVGNNNVFKCIAERVVEDERRFILVLAIPGGDGGYSKLRMEINKRDGAGIKAGDELLITVEPSAIMLLRG